MHASFQIRLKPRMYRLHMSREASLKSWPPREVAYYVQGCVGTSQGCLGTSPSEVGSKYEKSKSRERVLSAEPLQSNMEKTSFSGLLKRRDNI